MEQLVPVIDVPTTATQPVLEPAPVERVIRRRKKRAPKHDFKDGNGRVPAHKHDNGGGWVADTAIVDPGVYVGARCEIYDRAQVRNEVRLEGRSKISGVARVRDSVVLHGTAHIFGGARVSGRTILRDQARVCNSAHVDGNSAINGNTIVSGEAIVHDSAIAGVVQIFGMPRIYCSTLIGYGREGVHVNDNAVLNGATIHGAGRVVGSAKILNSEIQANRPDVPFSVEDFAIIAEGSSIYTPIQVKDHAIIIGSRVVVGYGGVTPTLESRITVSNNRVLNRVTFSTYESLVQFLQQMPPSGFTAPADVPATTPAFVPAAVINAAINNALAPNAPRPVVLPNTGRRLIRVVEPT